MMDIRSKQKTNAMWTLSTYLDPNENGTKTTNWPVNLDHIQRVEKAMVGENFAIEFKTAPEGKSYYWQYSKELWRDRDFSLLMKQLIHTMSLEE